MRILVADFDSASRRCVRRILSQTGVHQLVGEAEDAPSITEMARRSNPDVVILSQDLISGNRALISHLITKYDVNVLLTAVSGGGSMVWRGMTDGACSYLLKDRLRAELGMALDAVEAGGAFVSPPLVRQLIDYVSARYGGQSEDRLGIQITRRLLPRERETLHRLAAGQSTDEIATAMSVETATVRAYVSRVLRKLGLRSRGEAVALAYRSGFYVPDQEMVRPSSSGLIADAEPAASVV